MSDTQDDLLGDFWRFLLLFQDLRSRPSRYRLGTSFHRYYVLRQLFQHLDDDHRILAAVLWLEILPSTTPEDLR